MCCPLSNIVSPTVRSGFDRFLDDYTYYSFFFSSRRRHTRSKRDWSSDVCSSDLRILQYEAAQIKVFGEMAKKGYIYKGLKPVYRSEERRVGKECRSRRSPDH